jgi:hypothetical protein
VRCFKLEGKLEEPWIVFLTSIALSRLHTVVMLERTDVRPEERSSLLMQGPSESVLRDVRCSYQIRKMPTFIS